MKRIHIFFVNVFILTFSSVAIQSIMLWFNSYITNKVGAEGMGLYHLIMSVYGVSVNLATSGISLAVTRLVAQDKPVIKTAVKYSLFFGIFTFVMLFFNAEMVGVVILKDLRTVKSIKILAISMPFIALSSVLNGYFTAKSRVIKTVFALSSELFIKITTTSFLLHIFGYKSTEQACIAIFTGGAVGEIFSFIVLLYLYFKQKGNRNIKYENMLSEIISISMPVAISTYIRSGLNTIKQTAVPQSLQKYGLTYSKALSSYGMINGMVMPIIAFPMSILYSCSNLLVPEIAKSMADNNIKRIKRIVKKALATTSVFAVIVFILCICYYNEISAMIYGNNTCGKYILLMSPIIITMYIDAVCDGMLKGLNLQVYSMKLNIADSVMCIILIPVLVRKFGLYGYIATLYISEILNTTLSLKKLVRVVF